MFENSADLKITYFPADGDPLQVRLSMAGEIDIAADRLLADLVAWLVGQEPSVVFVDLADVTFAGSALPNFLTRTALALPDAAAVVVRDATPGTRWVLRATDMPKMVTIADAEAPDDSGWAVSR